MHNPICLSFVSRFFIRRIKPTPLVNDTRRRVSLAQRRLAAFRANGQRVIGVMLEILVLVIARCALIRIDWHVTPPSCKHEPDDYSAS